MNPKILQSVDGSSDPGKQIVVVAFAGFEQADQKRVRFIGGYLELEAIQAQENICSEKGDALVSIDKGMIHDERFEQGRAHFREILIVSGLRSEKSAVQEAEISNSRLTAKSPD